MSDTNYTRWYREGSATLTQNSDVVTGTNTYWLNANIKPGDMFSLDSSKFYEVETVDSNTQITLKTPYLGATISNANYAVIRNFTATLPAETAAKVVTVLAKNEKYVDEPMNTLRGQSAYEIAVDKQGFVGNESEWLDTLNAYGVAKKNGYIGTLNQWLESLTAYGIAKEQGFTGTKDAWLESLLAAGEWSTLKKWTKALDPAGVTSPCLTGSNNVRDAVGTHAFSQYYLHNSIVRGKNLGSKITDEQLQAIHDGTFDDIFLGDYWEIPSGNYTYLLQIVEINRYISQYETCMNNRNTYTKDNIQNTGIFSYADAENFNLANTPWNLPINADEGRPASYTELWATATHRNHIVVMASMNGGYIFIKSPPKFSMKLDETGYAYDPIFRTGLKESSLYKNVLVPAFGEDNFLTWVEMLYTTFDSTRKRPAGPQNFLCKIEAPSLAQLTGFDFAGLNFTQGFQHEYGGALEVMPFEQKMFALFEHVPAMCIYSPSYVRDYALSDTYMVLRNGLYALSDGICWQRNKTTQNAKLNACPYFCIGVNSDD